MFLVLLQGVIADYAPLDPPMIPSLVVRSIFTLTRIFFYVLQKIAQLEDTEISWDNNVYGSM